MPATQTQRHHRSPAGNRSPNNSNTTNATTQSKVITATVSNAFGRSGGGLG